MAFYPWGLGLSIKSWGVSGVIDTAETNFEDFRNLGEYVWSPMQNVFWPINLGPTVGGVDWWKKNKGWKSCDSVTLKLLIDFIFKYKQFFTSSKLEGTIPF
jgi:hypothetical protein